LLVFILFFDLILLVSLGYYYTKLGHKCLKFGAAALTVEMFSQTAFSVGALLVSYQLPFVLGGIGKIVFAALMLVCIAHLVKRKVPMTLMLAGVIFYSAFVVYVMAISEFGLTEWIIAEIPVVTLLLVSISYLFKARSSQSLGILWLSGLLVLHVCFKLVLPTLLQNETLFVLFFFYNSTLVMIISVVLIMISSERMIVSLDDQNAKLEKYELENRRLEMQFSQARKLESLGVLAGGIAHDFNSMLTSILGYSGLAMKKLPTESDVRKDLYMVMSGARQAVDLTSQMLVYAGKGAIEFETLNISEMVGKMSSLVNSVVPKKIKVIQNLTRDLPLMKGDQVQLDQVLMNLVTNAVDAIEGNPGS